jgi:hypothetical protein
MTTQDETEEEVEHKNDKAKRAAKDCYVGMFGQAHIRDTHSKSAFKLFWKYILCKTNFTSVPVGNVYPLLQTLCVNEGTRSSASTKVTPTVF